MIHLTEEQFEKMTRKRLPEFRPLKKIKPPRTRKILPRALNEGEEGMARDLRANGIGFTREFKFNPDRKWRFDFALDIPHTIAIEIEGGAYTGGRHVRGAGFYADCIKYNAAAVMGWRVLRFTPCMVKDGTAIKCVLEAIK